MKQPVTQDYFDKYKCPDSKDRNHRCCLIEIKCGCNPFNTVNAYYDDGELALVCASCEGIVVRVLVAKKRDA